MGNPILFILHSVSTLQPHLPRGGEASHPSCLEAGDSSPGGLGGIQIHTQLKALEDAMLD